MSALASARAERAALCDRPAPAGTLDLSLGVFGFARGSRVVSLKALGVPVACSHDLGASHHDRRHFIDKDFLLSLPNGAHLLEAARATKPSPPCRAVVCLADADVHEIGSDVSRLAEQLIDARGLDAPHPTTGASLRVLGMLPAPLPVTLRVRPGALAGSPRSDAGDAHASARKITARLADVVVVDNLPVPAHVSLRRATECASARGRDDVVADLVLCVCDPRAPKTKPNAFPERYRARIGWEGVKGGEHPGSDLLDELSGCDENRASVAPRLWFANQTKKATRAAAVYDAEDRFAAERHRLLRAPDDAVAVACARCGAREGKPFGRALRRCAGCVHAPGFEDENDSFSHYCSKACQARDWGRHRDVCHSSVAGRRRRREIGFGA